MLAGRIGPSLQLGLQAIIFGTVLGTILGTISAMKQNTWADTSSTLVAILGRSIPNFVFAVLLQYIFAIKLQVLPMAKWDGPLCTRSCRQLHWPMSPLLIRQIYPNGNGGSAA